MEQHEHKIKGGELDTDKLWAILAYIFFPLPILFVKDRSGFLNYHINQGIIFALVSIIGNFILGSVLHILVWAFHLFMIIIFIMAIIAVSKKKKEPMPIIGDLFNFIKE